MPDNKEPKADFSDVEATAPRPRRRQRTDLHGGERRHSLEDRQEYYGSAGQWRRIYEANKDVIKNPDLIYPGQTFKIPEA